MHEVMKPQEKHVYIIFPVLIVLLLMSASAYYLLVSKEKTPTPKKVTENVSTEITRNAGMKETITDAKKTGEFGKLVDDENTPEEVDSAVVEELDSILDYIDNNVETDDFSDLGM